jgi:ribosomal-protein-alanine N-acetyltransferase
MTPRLTNIFTTSLPLRLDKTRKWFENTADDESRYDFIIETKDKKAIGLIGLIGINHRQEIAEFYIVIGEKSFWNKGYATQALASLVKWGFDKLKLEKIWAITRKKNLASITLMQKIGFQIEGTLRKEKKVRNKREDVYRLGLLKNEFKFPVKHKIY